MTDETIDLRGDAPDAPPEVRVALRTLARYASSLPDPQKPHAIYLLLVDEQGGVRTYQTGCACPWSGSVAARVLMGRAAKGALRIAQELDIEAEALAPRRPH